MHERPDYMDAPRHQAGAVDATPSDCALAHPTSEGAMGNPESPEARLTKQTLEWLRLDSATSINDEGGPFHRLLIQCTTEGVAVDFKVGMKVEDVIRALRSVADRLEHRVGIEPSEDLGGCSIACSGCGRETILRYTDRTKTHVSIASVTGWTYVAGAGIRCPKCEPEKCQCKMEDCRLCFPENRSGDAHE